jgi:uncharacterized membrane-anchored protein YitT (DUF2179 family)
MSTSYDESRIFSLREGAILGRGILWNLALIALGSGLCALAINGILIPKGYVSGGVTGVALLIYYLFPYAPVAVIYFLLNLPLFAVGWIYVGRRFFLYSLAGMVIFSAAVAWVQIPIHIENPILATLLAGIITGGGSGIILKSLGSAGGTDILSVILLKRFSIRLGTTILAFNCLILISASFLSLESALYTLIYLYVTSHILDLVVTGLSQRKAVFIVSSRWEEISDRLISEIKRGVTVMKGQGGYSGREENILYTVVTFRELSSLKRMIQEVDPQAFVVVTDTLEVMGNRIGNQPHW